MTTFLSPLPKLQFFGDDGNPLVGGKLYTYAAGTSTPLVTYTDSTGTTANTNPVILDSRGEANVWLSNASYKIVLKTSTETLIWTVDNISTLQSLVDAYQTAFVAYQAAVAAPTGSALVGFIQAGTGAVATTVQARLRQSVSVKDFGATGDGSTNDTTAIQNALNAGAGRAVYFPAGTYMVSTTLVVKSKTTLMGDGINKSNLKFISGSSASIPLLRNDVQSGTANVYYDTDLEFYGLTFDGNNIFTRTVELLSIAKVLNTTFTGCSVQNNTYIGIAFTGVSNVIVSQSYFTNNGRPRPSTTSGPAIWTASTVLGYAYDVRIENNYFYENNWSAAYFMPSRGSFTNNTCVNNGESTIFCNDTGSYLRIENNTISGTTRSNISGSGIELGSPYSIISGNTIDSCASSGVALTDVQNVIVCNNQIFNNGQDTAFDPYVCGIVIIGSAASPYQPDHIQISGNRIGDRQAVKTQYAGIGFGGTGAACTNVAIYNNDLVEQKTATFFNLTEARFGTGCYTQNNYDRVAALQPPFRYATFTLNAAAGAQTITGIGFRPRALRITAVLSSATQAITSMGSHDGTSGSVIYSTVDSAGRRGGQTTGIISLRDSAAGVIAAANLQSYDVDGFTLNVITGFASCVCTVECY
jgi:hypothetical protein